MHNDDTIISLGWMHSQTGCFDNVRLGFNTLDKVQNWLDKELLCLNILLDPRDVQCLHHISTFTLKYEWIRHHMHYIIKLSHYSQTEHQTYQE